MKNVLIKSSIIFILFCVNCKKNENTTLVNKDVKTIINNNHSCDTLIIKKDTIFLKNDKLLGGILTVSSLKKSYILPVTTCIDEYGWSWNIAFSCLDDEYQTLLKFKKEYKNFDFDFVLYQSRNDEFFFKIKNKKLYLVAYKYSIKDVKQTGRINAKNDTIIENVEIIKEKFIPLSNKFVTKIFKTNFICKYRNDLKYPFIIKTRKL
jgi:hypothetical protein